MVELYKLDINEKVEQHDVWQDLFAAYQNQSILKGKIFGVEEYTIEDRKVNALAVMLDDIKGIIPQNECGIDYPLDEKGNVKLKLTPKEQTSVKKQLMELLDQDEPVKVISINREEEFVHLSRKAALEHLTNITWGKLSVGMTIKGKVRQITKIKVILDVGGIIVSMPKEELSWGFLANPWAIIVKGQELTVKVMEVDKKKHILKVSYRECLPNPWPACTKRYKKSNTYRGKVTSIIDKAVFVNLQPGVDVYCQHMKFERLRAGDIVMVEIKGIDNDNKSIWGNLSRKLETMPEQSAN